MVMALQGIYSDSDKLRMKSISAFAIQQTEVILVQVRLHRSFRKSCPAKGARRTESPAQHENFSY